MTTFDKTLPALARQQWWLQPENALLQGSPDQLTYRLLQYAELPLQIVALFRCAISRLDRFDAVKTELRENIADELGARTAGVAHVTLLQRQLRSELGVDLASRVASPQTKQFITDIKQLIDSSAEAAAGVSYALEVTAIQELQMIASLINRLAEQKGFQAPIRLGESPELPDSAEQINLHCFFNLHTELIEQDHQQHLAEAIQSQTLSQHQYESLSKAFLSSLRLMDSWFRSILQA